MRQTKFLSNGCRKYCAAFGVIVVVLSAVLGNAVPGLAKQIKGKKAVAYLNDHRGRIAQGGYYALVLRSYQRDPLTDSDIDALVYSSFPNALRIVRDNGYHRLRLSVRRGRPAVSVTPDDYASFESIISRERLSPQVVFDRAGKELCIVYSRHSRYTLTARTDADGDVLFEFETERHKQNRNRLLDANQGLLRRH
ncbi:MAG: hypothetical protein PHO30_02405 [Candidatus Omnitrophica bacterium]|nr:hypothetical protein [Candidatus Omnitrophota bacterium]